MFKLGLRLTSPLKFNTYKYAICKINDNLKWSFAKITKIEPNNKFEVIIYDKITSLMYLETNKVENLNIICFINDNLLEIENNKIIIKKDLKEYINKLYQKYKYNLIKPNKLWKILSINLKKFNEVNAKKLEEKKNKFDNLISLINSSLFKNNNEIIFIELANKIFFRNKMHNTNNFKYYKKNQYNFNINKKVSQKETMFGNNLNYKEIEFNSDYKEYYRLFLKEDINLIEIFLKNNRLATLIPNITYSNLNPLDIVFKSKNDNFYYGFIKLLSEYINYNHENINLSNKIKNIFTGQNSKHTYGHETRTVQLSRKNKVGNMIFNKDNISIESNNRKIENGMLNARNKKIEYFEFDENISFNNFFSKRLLNSIAKYVRCLNRFKYLCNWFKLLENDCIENFNLFIENNNIEIAEYLSEIGFSRGFFGFNKYFKICINGNLEDLNDIKISNIRKKLYISSGFLLINASFINPNKEVPLFLLNKLTDYNLKDKLDRNLLFYSAISPHIEIIDFLIKKGLNINEFDKNMHSILMTACIYDNDIIVDYILKLNLVNINYKNKNGYAAIHYCARYNSLKSFNLLFEKNNKSIKLKGPKGKCIFSIAAKYGNKQIIDLVIKKTKFNCSTKDKFGMTPLMYAIMSYNNECFNTLLLNGADYTMVDSSDNNLLHYVAGYSNLECLDMLISLNLDPNLTNIWNYNPLNIAYLKGNYSFFDKILKYKNINVNLTDNEGKSILCNIAQDITKNNLYLIKLMSNQKLLDLKKIDIYGNIPLHYLAYNNLKKNFNYKELKIIYKEYFELFYSKNCLNINNKNGENVLEISLKKKNYIFLKLLVKKLIKINSNAFNNSLITNINFSIYSNLIDEFKTENFKIWKLLHDWNLINKNLELQNNNSLLHTLVRINNNNDNNYYTSRVSNIELYKKYFDLIFDKNLLNKKNIYNETVLFKAIKDKNYLFIELLCEKLDIIDLEFNKSLAENLKYNNFYILIDEFSNKSYKIFNLLVEKGIINLKYINDKNESYINYLINKNNYKKENLLESFFNLLYDKEFVNNLNNRNQHLIDLLIVNNILLLNIFIKNLKDEVLQGYDQYIAIKLIFTNNGYENFMIIKKNTLNYQDVINRLDYNYNLYSLTIIKYFLENKNFKNEKNLYNFKMILKEILKINNNLGVYDIKNCKVYKDKYYIKMLNKTDYIKLNIKKKFKNHHRNNIFHILFTHYNKEIIQLMFDEFNLIEHIELINYRNFKKISPFEIFILNNNCLEFLDFLIKNNANFNIKSNKREYLINKLYLKENFYDIIYHIKTNNYEYYKTIDFNLYDKNQINAPIHFVKNRNLKVLELIFDEIDINSQDNEGKTPLIYSIIDSKCTYLKLVILILSNKNLKIYICDKFERNIFHYLFITSAINNVMCSLIFVLFKKFVTEELLLKEDIYKNTSYHYYFMTKNNLLNNNVIRNGSEFLLKKNISRLNILLLSLIFKNSSVSILILENTNFNFEDLIEIENNYDFGNNYLYFYNNFNKPFFVNLFMMLGKKDLSYKDTYNYYDKNFGNIKYLDILDNKKIIKKLIKPKPVNKEVKIKDSSLIYTSSEYESKINYEKSSSEDSLEFEVSINENKTDKLNKCLDYIKNYYNDNTTKKYYFNIFQISLIFKNYEFCCKLLSLGYKEYNAIVDCIKVNDIDFALNLILSLSNVENIIDKNENLLTIFINYSIKYNYELLDLITFNYPQLYFKNELKRDPLFYAIKKLDIKLISYIIDYFNKNKEVNNKDIYNHNHLSFLIIQIIQSKCYVDSYIDIIIKLIENFDQYLAFNFSFENRKLSNCLIEIYKYNRQIVQNRLFKIILNISDIYLKNYEGENIVSLAFKQNDYYLINILLDLSNIDINERCYDGNNIVSLIIKIKDERLINKLISMEQFKSKVDINEKYDNGDNIISLAIKIRNKVLIETLINMDQFNPNILINEKNYIYLLLKFNKYIVYDDFYYIIEKLIPLCFKNFTNKDISNFIILTYNNKYKELFKNFINYNDINTNELFKFTIDSIEYNKYQIDIENDFSNYLNTINKLKEKRNKIEKIYNLDNRCISDGVLEKYKNQVLDYYMIKIDLKKGFYSEYVFYKIQYYFDKIHNTYNLFTNWGRINEDGQFQITPYKNRLEGIEEFKKIYKNMTHNNLEDQYIYKFGKYKIINNNISIKREEINYNNLFTLKNDKIKKSFLDKEIYDIIYNVYNFRKIHQNYLDLNLDGSKIDIFDINSDYIKNLLAILEEINKNIKTMDSLRVLNDQENIDKYYKEVNINYDLNAKFYELFPLKYSGYMIDTIDSVNKYINIYEKIKKLYGFEDYLKIILAAENQKFKINPIDYIYSTLNCKLKLLTRSKEFLFLYRFINNDIVNKNINVNNFNIYAFENKMDVLKNFNDKSNNIRLLFHGTRGENLLSILKNGLLVNVSNSTKVGQRLGQGLYFADTFEKASHFSHSNYSYSNNTRYVLVCEVDLGKMYKSKSNYDLKEDIYQNYDSIKSCGLYKKNKNSRLYTVNNVMIPFGQIEKRKRGKSGYNLFNYNEYLLFDHNRVKIKYIIKIN